MYKKASQHMRSRAEGIRKDDLVDYEDNISDDEKIEFLRKKLRALEEKLIQDKSMPKSEREHMGRIKNIMQTELSKLKANRPAVSMDKFLVDAAKRLLVPELWDAIMEEAKRAYDIHNKSGK